ncbi:hypothetical protein BDR07DRAFT_1486399 [Suillus spraguei]|nr:hypothetical protein BDR07DRAFT_1486399 [Suillus spraguei]
MSDRRFWEHNSHPGLVLISGVEYDVSRTSDGMIHCPVPTCSNVFKRRSTFKSHIEHHKDILEVPALAPQSNSSDLRNTPQLCVAVHPHVSAVTFAEGPFQLPDNKAPTAQVISPIRTRRSIKGSTSPSNNPISSLVDVSAISEAGSIALRGILDTYLQEKLVPLLNNAITQDILPSVLRTLQSSSTRTVAQIPISAPAMEPVIDTGRHVPVQSEGDSGSNNAQHPVRFPIQLSSSSSHLTTPLAAPVNRATGMLGAQSPTSSPSPTLSSSIRLATSSPSSSLRLALPSSSPVAYPTTRVPKKRLFIQEQSNQLHDRDGPKRIRLKAENHEKSLAVASSSQAEDLWIDDDQDSCSFRKEACSSQSEDLIIMDEDEEIEILSYFSERRRMNGRRRCELHLDSY